MSLNLREETLHLLHKTFFQNGYSNHLLNTFFGKQKNLNAQERGFVKALYFGVLRTAPYLDHHLAQKLKRPMDKLDEKALILLRMGLYQLIFMDGVPAHSAVDETVTLAKAHASKGAVGMVNAVLRSLSKDKPQPPEEPHPSMKLGHLSALLMHPSWMVTAYIKRYGFRKAVEILRANNQHPPLTARVNDQALLERSGVPYSECRFTPYCVELTDGPKTAELIAGGILSPQDQSSVLAASLLAGAKGPVLELCTGRGNKTAILRRMLDEKEEIYPTDLSLAKLGEIKKQKLANVFPFVCNATEPLPLKKKFGAVFLDAPCSNLGTVRRHPELRYRRTHSDARRFAKTQLSILKNASEYVDDDGLLLYAVCSFEAEETNDVLDTFLAQEVRYGVLDISENFPKLLEAGLTDGPYLRVFPGQDGMDGFFAALLKKRQDNE